MSPEQKSTERVRAVIALRTAAAADASNDRDAFTQKFLRFFADELDECIVQGGTFAGVGCEVLTWIKKHVVQKTPLGHMSVISDEPM